MISRELFFIWFYLSLAISGYAQEWILKKEKNGISIYVRKNDAAPFDAIKVETEAAGTIEKLVSIVKDVAGHKKWAYGMRTASILRKVSENEIVFYKEIESPSPISDRDMVINLKVSENEDQNSIKIESVALPDYIPRKKNFVRVTMSHETWIVTKLTEQKIAIRYFLQVDPGGALSPFLVNLFSTKGPYESFEKLKALLEK